MLISMIKRNIKIFFKDKGMFFAALITPIILLVLYTTFLGSVYEDSIRSAFPEGFEISDGIIGAAVGGQLISSILAVCCITTAFSSNMLMVQDKVNGTRKDLTVTPVKSSVLALSYYIATMLSTLIIAFTALGAGLIYIHSLGWYLTFSDILHLAADTVLLVLFGTALSSIVNIFISTQGQISAVGTVVSAGYGFLCGAYMPISSFGEGLRKFLSFLPGTYGTSLLRNHAMGGAFNEIRKSLPDELVDKIMEAFDCKLYFSENEVTSGNMYIYLTVSVIVLIIAYILINSIYERKSL